MRDILNRELAVGMVCAFNPPKYKGIVLCKIVAFTPKRVKVQFQDWKDTVTTTVDPFALAILDEKDVVLYYLKKKG